MLWPDKIITSQTETENSVQSSLVSILTLIKSHGNRNLTSKIDEYFTEELFVLATGLVYFSHAILSHILR